MHRTEKEEIIRQINIIESALDLLSGEPLVRAMEELKKLKDDLWIINGRE